MKMRVFFRMAGMSLAVGTFFGCQDRDAPVDPLTKEFAVRVNDQVLTLSQCKDSIDVFMALQKKKGRAIPADKLNEIRQQLLSRTIESFIEGALLKEWARTNGLVATEAEIQTERDKLATSTGMRKKPDKDFYSGFTASQLKVIEDGFVTGILANKVREKVLANVSVKPGLVDEIMEKARKRNLDAAATNCLVYARATNCWQQIVSGKLTFEEAVGKFDENEHRHDAIGDWGEFSLQMFQQDPQLAALLPKMLVDDVTPPVEANGGLVIVKLLGKGSETSPVAMVPVTTYHLAHIYFKVANVIRERTRQQVETEVVDYRRKLLFQDFVKKLRKAAVIEKGK